MTDTSPAALRALADEINGAITAGKDYPSLRPRWERHSAVLMMRTEATLRAVADQMEAPPPQDVVTLVIAARKVAFGEPDLAALKALDRASEAFSERVPWEDEPHEDTQP